MGLGAREIDAVEGGDSGNSVAVCDLGCHFPGKLKWQDLRSQCMKSIVEDNLLGYFNEKAQVGNEGRYHALSSVFLCNSV